LFGSCMADCMPPHTGRLILRNNFAATATLSRWRRSPRRGCRRAAHP
jgi:hypothetical protein